MSIFFPLITETDKVQSAWVGALLGVGLAIGAFWVLTSVGLRFPDKTIVEYSQTLLGPFFGRLIGLVLIFLWMFTSSSLLRGVAEAYTIALMPETPGVAFVALMTAISANAARNGLEVLARTGEIVFWAVVVSFVGVIILPVNLMQVDSLLPVFPGGIGPVVVTAGDGLAFYATYMTVGMLLPHLANPSKVRRVTVYAILTSGAFVVVFTLALVAVFGPLASGLPLPAFNLNRVSNIAFFIERTEILSMLSWTVSSLVSLALFLWAAALGISQILGLKHHRHLIYPLAFVVSSAGLRMYESFNEFHMFFAFPNWDTFAISTVSIVLLAIGVSSLFHKKGRV